MNGKEWLIAGMSGSGIDGCIAQPTRREWYRGKIRRGDLYGKVYATSDLAFKAMRDHGYGEYDHSAGSEFHTWRKAHNAKFDIVYIVEPKRGMLFTLPRTSIDSFFSNAKNVKPGLMIIPAGKTHPIAVTI